MGLSAPVMAYRTITDPKGATKAFTAGVRKGTADAFTFGVTKPAAWLSGVLGDKDAQEHYKLKQQVMGEIAQSDFDKAIAESRKEIEEAVPDWISDKIIDKKKISGLATTGASIVGQVAPTLLGTVLSKDPRGVIALGSSLAGLQTGGAKQAELAEHELELIKEQNPDISDVDARVMAVNRVSGQAGLQALKTAGITAAGGVLASKLGLMGVETGLTTKSFMKAQSGRLGQVARGLDKSSNITRLAVQSGLEGVEESIDSAIESGLDWGRGFKPDMTLKDAAKDAAESFGWGFLLGSGFGQLDPTTRVIEGETVDARLKRIEDAETATKAEAFRVEKDRAKLEAQEFVDEIVKKAAPKLEKSALDWAKAQIEDPEMAAIISDEKLMSVKLGKIEERRKVKELEEQIAQPELEEGVVPTQLEKAQRKASREGLKAELEDIKAGRKTVFSPQIEKVMSDWGVNNLEDAYKAITEQKPSRVTPAQPALEPEPQPTLEPEEYLDPSSAAAQQNELIRRGKLDQPVNVRDPQAERRDPDKASTVIGETFVEKIPTEKQAKKTRRAEGSFTPTTLAMQADAPAVVPKDYQSQVFGMTPANIVPTQPPMAAEVEFSQQVPAPIDPTPTPAPAVSPKAANLGKILKGPEKKARITREERRLIEARNAGRGFEQTSLERATVQKGLDKIAKQLEAAKGRVMTYGKNPPPEGVELRQSGATPQQVVQGAIDVGILAVRAGVKGADIADMAISNLKQNAKSANVRVGKEDREKVLDAIGAYVAQEKDLTPIKRVEARVELKGMGYKKLNLDPEAAEVDVESDVIINPFELFESSEIADKKFSESEKRILKKAKAAAKVASASKKDIQLDPQMATETDLAMSQVLDSIFIDKESYGDALDIAWNSLSRVQRKMLDRKEFNAELSMKMQIVLDMAIKDNISPSDAMKSLASSGNPISLKESSDIFSGKSLREGWNLKLVGAEVGLMDKLKQWLATNAPDEAIRRGYTLLGNQIAKQWIRNQRLAGLYESLVYKEFGNERFDINEKLDKEQAEYRKEREKARREGREDPSMDTLSPEAQKIIKGIDAAFLQQGIDGKSAKVKQVGKDGKWAEGAFNIGAGGSYQILKKEYRDLIPKLHADILKTDKLTKQEIADTKAFIEGVGAEDIKGLMRFIDSNFDPDPETRKSNANSGLEKKRENPISVDLIDFGVDSFLAQSRSWAKRLSEIEAYGQGVDGKPDLFESYIDLIGLSTSPRMKGSRTAFSQDDIKREVEFIKDLKQHILEIEEGDRKVSDFVKGLGKGTSYTLLSGLSSAINNVGAIGQIAASGMAMGRKRAALKAITRMAVPKKIKLMLPSKFASMIGDGDSLDFQALNSMGIIGRSLDSIAAGYQAESETGLGTAVGALEKIGKTLTRPFSWSEKAVRNLSAQMADVYLKEVQKANTEGTDPKLVKAFKAYAKSLKGVDVDAALNGDVNAEADFIIRVVSENVGSFKPQQLPRWMTTSTGRFFGKFMPFMIFMTQSTGRMYDLMKRERGTSASVGMLLYIAAAHTLTQESLAKLKEILFGRERNVASVDEILNSDLDRAFAKGGDRLLQNLSGAGTMGLAGWALDQFRYKDGIPTIMDTANLSAVKGMLDVARDPYAEGFSEKMIAYLRKQVSAYRDMERLLFNFGDFERARLEAAQNKRFKMRKAIERYGEDEGVEISFGGGEPTAMTPLYHDIRDKLYVNDINGARLAAMEAARKTEDRGRAWANVSSSILSSQPMKIGRSYSNEEQQKFINWAKEKLSADDYADIMDAQSIYKDTALKAGLITGDKYEADRYEEVRNKMKELMNLKPVKKGRSGAAYDPAIILGRKKVSYPKTRY